MYVTESDWSDRDASCPVCGGRLETLVESADDDAVTVKTGPGTATYAIVDPILSAVAMPCGHDILGMNVEWRPL